MPVNKMMGELMDDDRVDDVLIVMDEIQRIGDREGFPMVNPIDGTAIPDLHFIGLLDAHDG